MDESLYVSVSNNVCRETCMIMFLCVHDYMYMCINIYVDIYAPVYTHIYACM